MLMAGPVNEGLTPEAKQALGPLAYLRAAISALGDIEEFAVHLRFDDGEEWNLPALNLVVANGRWVAGGLPIAPRARLDDGFFDVVLVKQVSLAALAALAPRVLLGRHLDRDDPERLLFRRARRLQVRATPPLPTNADGEQLGPRDGSYEILPRVLEVITGPRPPALAGRRPRG